MVECGHAFLGVHSDAAYDRHMNKPKPRMPILATACCSLFSILALFADLPHPRTFFPFYFGLGFLAVVVIVWFWKRRSPNI